jgi:hypothetical protein
MTSLLHELNDEPEHACHPEAMFGRSGPLPNKPIVPTAPASPATNLPHPLGRHIGQPLGGSRGGRREARRREQRSPRGSLEGA